MPGTLTVGTLSDGTNSTSATNAIQGSAKSWADFNGVTTVSIRASFNISSITRPSAGNYTTNYTTSMPSANYSITTAMGNSGSTVDGSMNILSLATGSTQIYQKVSGSNPADVSIICFSVFN